MLCASQVECIYILTRILQNAMVFLKNCRIFFFALGENHWKAGGTYALQCSNSTAFAVSGVCEEKRTAVQRPAVQREMLCFRMIISPFNKNLMQNSDFIFSIASVWRFVNHLLRNFLDFLCKV